MREPHMQRPRSKRPLSFEKKPPAYQEPVTVASVTVPTVWPLNVIWPPAFTDTVSEAPDDAAVPSTSARCVTGPDHFATCPLVLMLMLQGWTVIVLPVASGDGAKAAKSQPWNTGASWPAT